MLKHYHGEFELPSENQANMEPAQEDATQNTQDNLVELRINGIDVPIIERAEHS